jgi:uncharacterized protein (DUF952 family)
LIYHITSRKRWAEAQALGCYRAPSLESEGFIHCSTRQQVLGVANDLYRGQTCLLLLCIDEKLLDGLLAWEAPAHPHPNQAEPTSDDPLFPHLYGALSLHAVKGAFAFFEARSGFLLPPDLP